MTRPPLHTVITAMAASAALAGAVLVWSTNHPQTQPTETVPLPFEPSQPAEFESPIAIPDDDLIRGEEVPPSELPAPIVTDRGAPIRVYQPRHSEHPLSPSAFAQRQQLEERLQLKRVGEHHGPSNCHGWVFTGGRYCLQPEDVELILRDNGYAPVAEPQAGDLVIYVDSRGAIIHSGVVHSVSANEVLIESQWGDMGRYIHEVSHQVYSNRCAFFRSPRAGHLLNGIEPNLESPDYWTWRSQPVKRDTLSLERFSSRRRSNDGDSHGSGRSAAGITRCGRHAEG